MIALPSTSIPINAAPLVIHYVPERFINVMHKVLRWFFVTCSVMYVELCKAQPAGRNLMRSRVRAIRKSKNLTLADVAARCTPPTTPVTIGRLETGARTLTLPWVNRIAQALDCSPVELLAPDDEPEIPVAAIADADGAYAPTNPQIFAPPAPSGSPIGLLIESDTGEWRANDQLWLDQLHPEDFDKAIGRDVLVPRPGGRFAFGRMVSLDSGIVRIQPHRAGARGINIAQPAWVGVPRQLIRRL
jgi:transcriptional regulator with XRE-family HTH domain